MSNQEEFMQLALASMEVVKRLKIRIAELKIMLKKPLLNKEQSMELQYWLRENTMALGEEQRLTSTEEGRKKLGDFEATA